MDLIDFCDKPAHRRWWLLQKALESAPLQDALNAARMAEDFLSAPSDIVPADAAKPLPVANELQTAPPSNELDFSGIGKIADSGQQVDIASDNDLDTEDQGNSTADMDELAVLASPDDVVRYLRQRDDVVVATGKGEYLVNGRFHETTTELLNRANRARKREKRPLFYFMPTTNHRIGDTLSAAAD